MKYALILPALLLIGCTPVQKEYTVIRETSRPVHETDEVLVSMPEENEPTTQYQELTQNTIVDTPQNPYATHTCTQQGCAKPAPTYFAGTYTGPQTQQIQTYPVESQHIGCGYHTVCGAQLPTHIGGNVLDMNTRTIQTVPVAPQPIIVEQQEMAYVPVLAQSMPIHMQAPSQTQTANQQSTLILQHPVYRDLVKCLEGDFYCIRQYESHGYIPLQPITPQPPQIPVQHQIPRW